MAGRRSAFMRVSVAGQGENANAGGPRRTDAMLAALVGLIAFAAYLATLYPGLTGVGDAAKFSFVGPVLGTPHAPGYPLYLIVSHLFSYLPVGTLAYRMNVLSAILGALTAALVYLIVRRLGAGRTTAVSAALALAFGDAFWSRALYAKGYTLNAALVAGGILALLRWDDLRRPADLYWAAAIFALSIGNHLTVIALLPALVLFPLLTDPRTALRPKTILLVLLFLLAGFAQYGLILVRTLQHAPYLEARASNLQELWVVMTARRFAHEIGTFPIAALLLTRVPAVARLLLREFTAIGLLVFVVGFGWLTARHPRRAMLLGLGACGVLALTANMSSNEDQGFLLSVFVLMWSVVGVGLERIAIGLRRVPPRPAAALSLAVALWLPCSQVLTNYRVNDHHADTAEPRFFDALFQALPGRAAIVSEEYRVDMMVLYKLLGEHANGSRDVRLIDAKADVVSRLHDEGFEVFAFAKGQARLAEQGFGFAAFHLPVRASVAPLDLHGREIYRLVTVGRCLDIGNAGWTDVSRLLEPKGRLTARIDNFGPFESRVVVYAGADRPLTPLVVGMEGAGTPLLSVESFDRESVQTRGRLAARVAADQAALPPAVLDTPVVTRAEVRVNDRGAYFVLALDLGKGVRAANAQAMVDRDEPKRARFCSYELRDDAWPAGEAAVRLPVDSRTVQFVEGWYPVEQRTDGTKFRWTTARAVLIVPLGERRPATVEIAVEPFDYPDRANTEVSMVVNGANLGSRPVPSGLASLSWNVAADRWRDGLNELVLEVKGATRPSDVSASRDQRLLGVSVTSIELRAEHAP
jgi:hypothetical protein